MIFPGTRVPKFGGCPMNPTRSLEAVVRAVHRGDEGALVESTPKCGLPVDPPASTTVTLKLEISESAAGS
jgi:hypothetical protein